MKKLSLNHFKNNLIVQNTIQSIKGGLSGSSNWMVECSFTNGGEHYYDLINTATGDHACGVTHAEMQRLIMS